MSSKLRSVFIFLAAAVLGLSAGCSGGGGTDSSAKMVTGVAATGAPIQGALITLKDSSPSPASLTATTASDGSFTFDTTGLTPPFIIKTSYSNATGLHNLYSMTTASGVTNITPLTTIIVAQTTGSGNLDTFYENHTPDELVSAASRVTQAVKDLQTVLAPLMEQYNSKNFDLLHGRFNADSTGIDAMMDAITVTVASGAVTITSAGGSPIFSGRAQNITAGTMTPPVQPGGTGAPDGAALYATNCSDCHGSLANSEKTGMTAVRLSAAISGNAGGMGYLATLTTADRQAIVAALMPNAPSPAPAPAPTPAPTPALDGAVLYATNCAACHGPLASSGKKGASVSRIQSAITGNIGNMGYLSTLSPAQVSAITTALVVITPAPTPAPSCGSCHAVPPAAGKHAKHLRENVSCATCHGSGYSATTVVLASHANGVKNVTSSIGWNPSSRNCANSCHGTEAW